MKINKQNKNPHSSPIVNTPEFFATILFRIENYSNDPELHSFFQATPTMLAKYKSVLLFIK